MESIKDARQFLLDHLEGKYFYKAKPEFSVNGNEKKARLKLYTSENVYNIVAVSREDGGYLGCTSTTRKARAGEDWNRGNDLTDGKLCDDIWNEIMADIVSNELITPVKPFWVEHFEYQKSIGKANINEEEEDIQEELGISERKNIPTTHFSEDPNRQ